jgi:Mce-associated membrane protein
VSDESCGSKATAEASDEQGDLAPPDVVDDSATADNETTDNESVGDDGAPDGAGLPRRRIDWARVVAFGLLPAITMAATVVAAVFSWQDGSARADAEAADKAVAAARDSTVTMLSYRPDTVDAQLGAVRDRLTGAFRDSYTSLVDSVVIPGAKQKQIWAVATVPGVASVSATADHAVVLVFVDQTVIIGNGAPSSTSSAVRVSLNRTGERWLTSGFDPI